MGHSESKRQEWWQGLTEHVSQYVGSTDSCAMRVDANAVVGSQTSAAVGGAAAQPQNGNGALFISALE
eukprot:9889392-Alexandrium_andersonii.AAC.1